MTKTILSPLVVLVLLSPVSAEPVRWSDGAGAIAEIDDDSFRWIAKPEAPSAATHYGMSYTQTTDQVTVNWWDHVDGSTRATATWQLAEITPLETISADGSHWTAQTGVEMPAAAWTTLRLIGDTLETSSYRHWWTTDLAAGVQFMPSDHRTLFAVPEPATAILAALAIAALLIRRRAR